MTWLLLLSLISCILYSIKHIARLKEESKRYDVYWSFVRIVIAIGKRQVFKSWRSKKWKHLGMVIIKQNTIKTYLKDKRFLSHNVLFEA